MFYRDFENKRMQFVATHAPYQAKFGPVLAAKGALKVGAPAGGILAERAPTGVLTAEAPEGEIQKYYTFNQTGNVMISSTEADGGALDPAVKELFKKASVFLQTMTAALTKKGKTLYDYDAYDDIISGSGLFVAMHEEDRTFDYASTELTLNTAIISAVLGSVSPTGGALRIAQKVVESLGGQLRIASKDVKASKKIAHMLLVCENLMGMPLANISLFYVDSKEAQSVSQSNCHGYVSTRVSFKYHQKDYMFVDPDYINKYSKEFVRNPDQEKLIDEFVALIKH
jgi:hypothetical protein